MIFMMLRSGTEEEESVASTRHGMRVGDVVSEGAGFKAARRARVSECVEGDYR